PASAFEKVDGVVVVLVDACGDSKDVGVEDDVFGREADFVDQQVVCTTANFNAALQVIGLALLVEGHDDCRRTIFAAQAGVLQEWLYAFFHGDGVDDCLALNAFEPGFDDFPLGAVDHDGNTRDVGFGGHHVEEATHAGDGVEHGFVQVDVDDLCAVFHLLAHDGEGFVVFFFAYEAQEHFAAGHVGALAYVDVQGFAVNVQGFQAGQAGFDRDFRNFAGCEAAHFFSNGLDVFRRGAAAAASHVDQAC